MKFAVAILASVALFFAASIAHPQAVLAHDDGLSCHTHPTGPRMIDVLSFSFGTENGRTDAAGRGLVAINANGEAQAKGTVRVWGDPHIHADEDARARRPIKIWGNPTEYTISKPVSATAECAPDGSITEIVIMLSDPLEQHRGVLTIIPRDADQERRWKPARFHLTLDGHEFGTYDGAIIVVSGPDGPLP